MSSIDSLAPLVLVVTLTVRRAELAAFRAFERAAARIMAGHGGAIAQAVVVDSGSGEILQEVHIVTFPSHAALAAYRLDPAHDSIARLREASVVATDILVGAPGPDYLAEAAPPATHTWVPGSPDPTTAGA